MHREAMITSWGRTRTTQPNPRENAGRRSEGLYCYGVAAPSIPQRRLKREQLA